MIIMKIVELGVLGMLGEKINADKKLIHSQCEQRRLKAKSVSNKIDEINRALDKLLAISDTFSACLHCYKGSAKMCLVTTSSNTCNTNFCIFEVGSINFNDAGLTLTDCVYLVFDQRTAG
jgi:hypothetical protein